MLGEVSPSIIPPVPQVVIRFPFSSNLWTGVGVGVGDVDVSFGGGAGPVDRDPGRFGQGLGGGAGLAGFARVEGGSGANIAGRRRVDFVAEPEEKVPVAANFSTRCLPRP